MRLLRRKAGRSGEEGFTLLELIVAMAILATGLLGIALAQLSAVKMSRQSRHLTHAMNLAQEQVETFQMMANADIPADGTYNDPNNPVDIDATDATNYTRRWIIDRTAAPFAGIIPIVVEVDWTDNNGNVRTTRLETMSGL